MGLLPGRSNASRKPSIWDSSLRLSHSTSLSTYSEPQEDVCDAFEVNELLQLQKLRQEREQVLESLLGVRNACN